LCQYLVALASDLLDFLLVFVQELSQKQVLPIDELCSFLSGLPPLGNKLGLELEDAALERSVAPRPACGDLTQQSELPDQLIIGLPRPANALRDLVHGPRKLAQTCLGLHRSRERRLYPRVGNVDRHREALTLLVAGIAEAPLEGYWRWPAGARRPAHCGYPRGGRGTAG
jgi:hypothetical protein